MDKNIPDIDRFFLNSLKNHAEDPPEKVWSSVENELNKLDAEKYKTRFKNTRRFAVVILALFMIGAAGVLVHENNTSNENAVAVIKETKNASKPDDIKNSGGNIADQNKIVLSNKKNFDVSEVKTLHHTSTNTKEINDENVMSKMSRPVEKITTVIAQPNMVTQLFAQSQNDHINIHTSPNASALNTLPGKASEQLSSTQTSPLTVKDTIANVSVKTSKPKATIKTTNRGFYITPFVSYDITSARSKDEYLYDNQGESEIAKREDADISYSLGVNAEYRFSNKFSLQSGFSFSDLNNKISPTVVNAVKDNSGAYKFKLLTNFGLTEIKNSAVSNPQSGDSVYVNSASLSVHYISIPVTAKYIFKPGKFNVAAIAGVGLNKIITEHTEVSYLSNGNNVEKSNKIEGLKKNFLTLNAGAELNYEIKKNMSIGFIPVMRYALTPVTQNAPVKTFPVNFGAGLSLKFKL